MHTPAKESLLRVDRFADIRRPEFHGRFDIVSCQPIGDQVAIVFKDSWERGNGIAYFVFADRTAFDDTRPSERLETVLVYRHHEELRSMRTDGSPKGCGEGRDCQLAFFGHRFFMCPPISEPDTRSHTEILENHEYGIVLAYLDGRDHFLILKTGSGHVRRQIDSGAVDERLRSDIVRHPDRYRYYFNTTSLHTFSGVSTVKETAEAAC